MHEERGKPIQVLVKGAPERILAMCEAARVDGDIKVITPEILSRFEKINDELASRGERVLGFAMRELTEPYYDENYNFDTETDIPNFPTSALTFLGFVSMIDPPRPGVKEAVAQCIRAGIKVFMVTGDHPSTALAIARNIGITKNLTENELRENEEAVPENYRGCIVVHGTEMIRFTQQDWDRILSYNEIVFARTMPQQKQDIVTQLHKLDMVVAMTGDGVNDAPALKAANVGVAMGSGASVAKEAAQIILLQDDFGAIVEGIRRGRQVFSSLKKVVMYVLMHLLPELIPFLIFIAGNGPLAIETVVILAIDLGTDLLPAIAMAYEAEESMTMDQPPRRLTDHLLSLKLIVLSYLTVGLLHTLICYFAFFYVLLDKGFSWNRIFGLGLQFRESYDDLNDERKQYFTESCRENNIYLSGRDPNLGTICTTEFATYRQNTLAQLQATYFITLVWAQVANIFNRKTFTESILSWHRLTNNRQMLGAVVFEIGLALSLIYIPGLNDIFLLQSIKAEYLFIGIWYIILLIFLEEIRKFFVRLWPNGLISKLTTV